jgi:hypothetical protein
VNATLKLITITLAPNGAFLGNGPLDENSTYSIQVLGCTPTPCTTGVLDDRGGSLGDATGNPIALDARAFRTPDPANVPLSGTASWPGPAPAPIPAASPPRRDVAAGYAGGKFFVVGGISSTGSILSTNLAYSPATNSWATMRSMNQARYGHAAVALGSKLYVIGGASTAGALASVEIYDTAANTWTSGPSLPAPRRYLGATVLDGAIYVAGGVDTSGFQQATVWRLTPGGAWVTMAPLPTGPRAQLTLTGTGTGATARLYAVGGAGTTPSTRVEIFDPNAGATGAWSVGPALPGGEGRALHGATMLDGYLYVLGGLDINSVPMTSVYYYDPLLAGGGGWQPANGASQLPDGRAAFGGQVAVLSASVTPNLSGVVIAAGRTASAGVTDTVLAGQHG